jgi:hypothetical protein
MSVGAVFGQHICAHAPILAVLQWWLRPCACAAVCVCVRMPPRRRQCSFEETVEVLMDAAVFSVPDRMQEVRAKTTTHLFWVGVCGLLWPRVRGVGECITVPLASGW